jgi:NADP-dependent 3-hydroxy acid dehydrogenase YdfG
MLTGVWNVLEVVAPDMIERGAGGSIIITSSTAGLSSIGLNTLPGQAGYTAAKHGVVRADAPLRVEASNTDDVPRLIEGQERDRVAHVLSRSCTPPGQIAALRADRVT